VVDNHSALGWTTINQVAARALAVISLELRSLSQSRVLFEVPKRNIAAFVPYTDLMIDTTTQRKLCPQL
jgi:hypothetical protein